MQVYAFCDWLFDVYGIITDDGTDINEFNPIYEAVVLCNIKEYLRGLKFCYEIDFILGPMYIYI